MKIQTRLFFSVITSVFLLSVTGCSSMAVKTTDIEQRTSFALGLDQGQFTISDRVDSGVRTDYVVKTNKGKTFRCYVTGTFSIVGNVVSDAICSNNRDARSSQNTSSTSCNALLKAAGKC